jgi:putative FmdB family regulatory protein
MRSLGRLAILFTVPIYEYRCAECRTRPSIFFRSLAAVEDSPACPNCGAHRLTRLISRTAQVLSEDSRMEALSDAPDLSGIDENDPKSMARWARTMGKQLGEEDLGDDFDQAVEEMESGGEDNGAQGGPEEDSDF